MKKTLLSALALIALGGVFQSCNKEASEPTATQTSQSKTSAGARNAAQEEEPAISGSLRSDSLALVDLYQATKGDNWHHTNFWLSEEPLSKWYGVHVDQVGGQPRVVGLYLGANQLKGTLPASIGQLTALRRLHLQYNRGLTGSLPESLFNLERLVSLRLRFTSLTGELPAAIGKLTKIDTLDLSNSQYDLSMWWNGDPKTAKEHRPNLKTLSGSLPKELGNLKKAHYIDLSFQGFSGELPKELGNLTELKYLALYGCQFEGALPESLGGLKSLVYFSAGKNKFSGAIPSSLGNLPELRNLLLSYNQLSGEVPASFGNLKSLQILNLEHNQLSGRIPAALTGLTSLYQLYLNGNKLTGIIPADLGGAQQPNLIWVDLRDNDLEGHLPARIKQFVPDEKGMKHIAELPEFGYVLFAVSGNRLSGLVPEQYLSYPKTLKLLLPQRGAGFTNLKNDGSLVK